VIVGLVVAMVALGAGADDGDRVPDYRDNCPYAFNPRQLDDDGDGCGNGCDADLNNDGVVGGTDVLMFARCHTSRDDRIPATAECWAADFNEDGFVNEDDQYYMDEMLGRVQDEVPCLDEHE
jgi:hypothetical protein